MRSNTRLLILRIFILLAVIALSIWIFMIRDKALQLAKYGYPGIFLLSILSNATIILPAPGILFVFAMGTVFNPFWVAIVAGLGAAIGELSGYLVGYGGRVAFEHASRYEKMYAWMKLHPTLSYLLIAGLAFVPNPFFDLAGIAAGALKIPVLMFLLFCAIGKIAKMLVIAYAGATSLNWWLSH
jgi:membrane protein YqaA with SNARE-associated domain